MDGQVLEKFQEHFGKMKDPRVERTKLYPLEEILFVLLCGSICGAESWRDFVMFGQGKLDFLREYFPFSAGIPCKNTFARVSSALQPEQFRACFIAWAASLQTVPGEVIAIEGKTLCNSANACTGAAAIHMVSASGTDSRLVFAQQKVADKSNEITAANARQITQAVRAHWAIENTLYWTLDVVFNEDRSTVRKDHASQNMAIVRHVMLNILNIAKNSSRASASRHYAKKQAGVTRIFD